MNVIVVVIVVVVVVVDVALVSCVCLSVYRAWALYFMYSSAALCRLTEARYRFFEGEFSPGNSECRSSCRLVGISLIWPVRLTYFEWLLGMLYTTWSIELKTRRCIMLQVAVCIFISDSKCMFS